MKPHKSTKIGTPFHYRGNLWSLGWHTGDDWLTPTGTKAYAMADGKVHSTSYNSSYGNNVIVESLDGKGRRVRWSVNHLSAIKVKTGQTVKAGQVIGLTGASGHVTGPHDHVEARVAPFTFAAQSFIDPQVMYDWQPKSKRPAWATRRPRKAPEKQFRAVNLNIGGMNDQGRRTLPTRAPKIVREIVASGADVVGIEELPNGFEDEFTALMVAAGYRRAVGQDGRYIYRKARNTDRLAFGVFDLQPRYKGDDKQAVWAVIVINGHAELIVCGHLESDAPANDQRVGQALDMIDSAKRVAAKHDLSLRRITFLADTNSDTWVRVHAFNERNWVDAAETAWRRYGLNWATFTGWVKRLVTGARIDGIFVYRSRPVVTYTTRTASLGLSDHLMIVADIGK